MLHQGREIVCSCYVHSHSPCTDCRFCFMRHTVELPGDDAVGNVKLAYLCELFGGQI